MALGFATFQYLVMRAAMVGELGSDYLQLGRAKGLSERTLKYRYAARNALLPSVTVAALQVGFAVTAAVFVERVFAYPGLGGLMFESVGDRDYPTMQGCFLVLAVAVVSANLLADVAYRRLDPRTVA
jgi:peptide/nickel transport system permease protein